MSMPPASQFPPIGPKKDKFTPELRILVASLLSVGIIILWTKYFGPKPPTHPPEQNQPGVSAPANSGTSATTPAPAETTASTAPSTVLDNDGALLGIFSERGHRGCSCGNG